MQQMIQFLKCIADETRFKMLKLLLGQRLCVCEMTEALEKSQPCISQHLRRFKELDLVIEERIEQWSYYMINSSVYQGYLKQLNELSITSYLELGLEDLEANLSQVKSCDLCNLKQKER